MAQTNPHANAKGPKSVKPTAKSASAIMASDPNAALIRYYEKMLEELNTREAKFKRQFNKAMMELGCQEQTYFERTCNLYSPAQLDMSIEELEEALVAEKAVSHNLMREKRLQRKSRLAVRIRARLPAATELRRRSSLYPSMKLPK